jgi:hypothetical protein
MISKRLSYLLALLFSVLILFSYVYQTNILKIVNNLNPVVLGATIAAGVTILGTFLQLYSSSYLLEKRIMFERIEKANERELNLKRDLYLNAIDDFNEMFKSLINLANVNIKMSEISELISKPFVNLSKVEVVGSRETCRSLKEVYAYFYTTIMEFIPKRKPIDDYSAEISKFQNQSDYCNKKSDELLAQMNVNAPEEYMKYLKEQFDLNMTKWKESSTNVDRIVKTRITFGVNLQQELTIKSMELNKLVSKCKQNIRCELKLPNDPIFTEQEIVDQNNDMLNKVTVLQNNVKQWIN